MIIKNIESKIRLATVLSAGSFLTALGMVTAVSFFSFRQVAETRKNVYVLDAASIPMHARQTDIQMNRPAEYRAHVNNFHALFFNLPPDEKHIEYQMKRAMYLIDETGALQYNNLKEKGFFNSVLSSSAILTVQMDSILIDPVKKYFRYHGKQKIDRRSSTVVRSLVTEGYLQDLDIRTENNPHGVLITRWRTLENKDISNVQKNAI